MNFRLTTVALAALILGAGLAYTIRTPAIPPSPTVTTGKALIGGPFSLIDQTGQRVTDRDFRGRYMLIYFGYTFCPDVCPASLQVISAALDQLGPDAGKITPVFITLDPARDTPAKLAEYIKSFHPRLVGLTGSPAEVADAVKAYRVYAKKVPGESNPADYTMDHSSIVFLMGPDGNLVTFAPDTTKVDSLVAQLRKGLAAKG